MIVRAIMKAWSRFAKDPKDGLTKFGWPVYDSSKDTVVVLGGRNSSAIKFVNRKTMDTTC